MSPLDLCLPWYMHAWLKVQYHPRSYLWTQGWEHSHLQKQVVYMRPACNTYTTAGPLTHTQICEVRGVVQCYRDHTCFAIRKVFIPSFPSAAWFVSILTDVSQKPAGICDCTDAGFSTTTSAQTLGASNDAQIVSVWNIVGARVVSYVMWLMGVVCSHICTHVFSGWRALFVHIFVFDCVCDESKLYAGWFYVLFSLSWS